MSGHGTTTQSRLTSGQFKVNGNINATILRLDFSVSVKSNVQSCLFGQTTKTFSRCLIVLFFVDNFNYFLTKGIQLKAGMKRQNLNLSKSGLFCLHKYIFI